MTSAEDAMKIFTAQWYNAVSTGLSLSPDQFQLMQGTTGTGTTDDTIWNFFDSIPPVSTNNYYNPAQHNSLAQAYASVINNLVPQNDDAMKTLLGNKYLAWTQYASDPANLPDPLPETTGGDLDVVAIQKRQFQRWGLVNGLDTAEIKAGGTLIEQDDIVTVAITQLVAAKNKYAYTATQGTLSDNIDKGVAKNINMNSATASSDTSHSWAKTSASGMFRFFSAGGSGSWDKFTQELHSEGLDLNVDYAKFATLLGGPYARKADTSADLDGYEPWWNSSALKTAQAHNNNKVWKRGAPTWDQTFGENGNLMRVPTALLVVDGIKTTMTSKVSVAKSEQESFKAAISGGFWPFFSISGEGGWEHNTTFNDDGSFTVTSECAEGNVNVIGALVSEIDDIIGGA